MFYDIFLMGYVDGLHCFLHVSEARPRTPGVRIVRTPFWREALEEAKVGLAMHREASAPAGAGKCSPAEELEPVPAFINAWDDESMLNCA